MKRYTIEQGGKRYVVEADSEEEAFSLIGEPPAPEVRNQEIPRPDVTSGPTARMDPFARTGYLMSTPEGQQAMQQLAGMVKSGGLEGGGATIGQAAGAATGPLAPAAVPLLGGFGAVAGNTIDQLTRKGHQFSPGEAGGAFIAGMVPGASVAKAPAKELVKVAAKQTAANIAAANYQSAMESGELASGAQNVLAGGMGAAAPFIGRGVDTGAAERATLQAVGEGKPLRDLLRVSKELDLRVPPVATNKTVTQKALHMMGGGTEVVNTAKEINGPRIVKIVRDELNIEPGKPLDETALNTIAAKTNITWDYIKKQSPEIAELVDEFKLYDSKAKREWAAYGSSFVKDASMLERARSWRAEANAAKELLKDELEKLGKSELWDAFETARVQRAKAEVVREALGPDGSIDPNVFVKAKEAGKKLDGRLDKLADWQSVFNKFASAQAVLPTSHAFGFFGKYGPGIGLGYLAGQQVGGSGAAFAGAALGGLALPPATRAFLLSKAGQNFAQPHYGRMGPDVLAEFARQAAQASGRSPMLKDEDLQRFLQQRATRPITFNRP